MIFYPLISIIVPTYQRVARIERCLLSVITQDYKNFELIVVDDGSTDGTHEKVIDICRQYPDVNIKYIYKENGGAQSARNRGILESNGEYIQFLDSDDFLHKENLTEKVTILESNPADMVVANVEILNLVTNERSVIDNVKNLRRVLASGGSIHTSAPLIAARLFSTGLVWSASIKREQDKMFAFRAVLMAREIITVNKTLSTYVIHDEPQISDGYHIRPQFEKFLLEDCKLFLSLTLPYPVQARFFLVRHAMHISRRALWYFTKSILALLLGKEVFERLRGINK